MRQIQEILRLKHQHQLSVREIARSCGLPASTVGDYVKRAEAAGLGWPLPDGLTEEQLIQRLLADGGPAAPAPVATAARLVLRPRGTAAQRRHPAIALAGVPPDPPHEGYSYSRFCELYQAWAGTLDPVLRQVHVPGEKMFVDWAGQTVPIHTSRTAVSSAAHLFVAVLGASNKTFAEAFANEQLAAWIARPLPRLRLLWRRGQDHRPRQPQDRRGRPCRYEPLLHRTYQEMAEHYGTVIVPARIKKPRDKAKVETGVQIAERQILAVLRDQRFFSVGELNLAITPLARQTQRPALSEARRLAQQLVRTPRERPRSSRCPRPPSKWPPGPWRRSTSTTTSSSITTSTASPTPSSIEQLDVRLTRHHGRTVSAGKRVAAHLAATSRAASTTLDEHRPKSHQRYLQWTPGRIVEWAKTIGPDCAKVVEQIMTDRPHPEQGFRSCLGHHPPGQSRRQRPPGSRLRRALHFGTCSYRSVESILAETTSTSQPLEQELPLPSPAHENLRGSPYYP